MEHLLTATLALDTTVTPKAQTPNPALKSQASKNSQSGEQRLMREKWKFTVPLLMLGIS